MGFNIAHVQKCYISVVKCARGICLICMPEAREPQAQGLRAYISGKSMLQLIHKLYTQAQYSITCDESVTSFIYVTGPDKTGLIALFCISRNTDFNIECTVLLWWLDTVTPDILYNKCSYIAIIS